MSQVVPVASARRQRQFLVCRTRVKCHKNATVRMNADTFCHLAPWIVRVVWVPLAAHSRGDGGVGWGYKLTLLGGGTGGKKTD